MSKNSDISSTFLAIGPSTERSLKGRLVGPCATVPIVGRRPTTPQKLAGFLKDPPKSEPVPNQAAPEANAAAVPPEEPPAV